ncbi:hypothetical protein B0J13DRAFT_663225 [Dactylonectria estremocensis]|uniref:Uncharacterized protein n=1 Tax=Dactylonectria estremocensis TaxID=1079267 RepID=A0A9P9F1J1_9HYPO|nr:hypothetical protein B0J13DRAFT_663225 [Dactylonectria estremocensis]
MATNFMTYVFQPSFCRPWLAALIGGLSHPSSYLLKHQSSGVPKEAHRWSRSRARDRHLVVSPPAIDPSESAAGSLTQPQSQLPNFPSSPTWSHRVNQCATEDNVSALLVADAKDGGPPQVPLPAPITDSPMPHHLCFSYDFDCDKCDQASPPHTSGACTEEYTELALQIDSCRIYWQLACNGFLAFPRILQPPFGPLQLALHEHEDVKHQERRKPAQPVQTTHTNPWPSGI